MFFSLQSQAVLSPAGILSVPIASNSHADLGLVPEERSERGAVMSLTVVAYTGRECSPTLGCRLFSFAGSSGFKLLC